MAYRKPYSLPREGASYGTEYAFYLPFDAGAPGPLQSVYVPATLVREYPRVQKYNLALRLSGLGQKIVSGNGAAIAEERTLDFDIDMNATYISKIFNGQSMVTPNPPYTGRQRMDNILSLISRSTLLTLGSEGVSYSLLGVSGISLTPSNTFNFVSASITLIF
jgi:hypothetical protein